LAAFKDMGIIKKNQANIWAQPNTGATA